MKISSPLFSPRKGVADEGEGKEGEEDKGLSGNQSGGDGPIFFDIVFVVKIESE